MNEENIIAENTISEELPSEDSTEELKEENYRRKKKADLKIQPQFKPQSA